MLDHCLDSMLYYKYMIDYIETNKRFDIRYRKLVEAGAKKHVFTGDVGYSRPFEVHGLLIKKFLVPQFISNGDLMWKPSEAFDSNIRELFGE